MEEIEMRSLQANIENEDSKDERLTVHGYIETGVPSKLLDNGKIAWREIIQKGVFGKAINDSIARGEEIDLLYNHDKNQILASNVNDSFILEEDEVGLYFEAKISETTWGKDAYTLIKDGIISGLSFGMRVLDSYWSKGVDNVNIRTITAIELFEVSILKQPAYASTLVETRGFKKIEDVDVPDDIELRLFGGTNILDTTNSNSSYYESKEKKTKDMEQLVIEKFYDGITLIANKLDVIIEKFDELEVKNTDATLEEAKEVLQKTTALVNAQMQLEIEKNRDDEIIDAETTQKSPKKTTKATVETRSDVKTEKRSVDEASEEDLDDVESVEKDETEKSDESNKVQNHEETDSEDLSDSKNEQNDNEEEAEVVENDNTTDVEDSEGDLEKPDEGSEVETEDNEVQTHEKELIEETKNVEETETIDDTNNVSETEDVSKIEEIRNMINKFKMEEPEIE